MAQAPGAQPPDGDAALEQIVVTGYRASLAASLQIKREATGVVDAISAEDIGKFPDTNLGEALQRMTGLSIDRRNGEGAVVTARGFGPQYNLITLNGRQMPTADGYGDGFGPGGGVPGETRSFNFANLSTEGVRAAEVYKTARADMSTGGIGATINILTYRPFDNTGMVATFGARALYDASVDTGDRLSPEFSGLFSYASENRTWGVSLSAEYQRRDSSAPGVSVTGWDTSRWKGGPGDLAANPDAFPHWNNNATPGDRSDDFIDATFVNAPADGQLYGVPSDIRYTFADRRSERVNAQLALQFAPSDALTFTTDYTFADVHLEEDRAEQTLWLQRNGFYYMKFDVSEPVATAMVMQEYTGADKDFAFGQYHREQHNALTSIGLNVDWHLTDGFRLQLDLHDSTARSVPDDPVTGGGQTMFGLAGRVPATGICIPPGVCTNFWTQGFDFEHGVPSANRTLYPTNTAAFAGTGGNADYSFDAGTLGTQVMDIDGVSQRSGVRQGRLDGSLEFAHGAFNFGVEMRALDMHGQESTTRMIMGDWGVSDAGNVPGIVDLLHPFSMVNRFHDFSLPDVPQTAWRGNANALGRWAITPVAQGGGGYGDWIPPTVPDGQLTANPAYINDTEIGEDTSAAYLQLALHGELARRRANLRAGVRYEKTEVDSRATFRVPRQFVWQEGGNFETAYVPGFGTRSGSGSYDYWLPSLDVDFAVTEQLKARASYGSTIARPAYGLLTPRVDIGTPPGSTLNGFQAVAFGADPGLLPLHSDNLDLSLEWYFTDNAYLAATWWSKRVTNFNASRQFQESLYGIRDQTAGPRALAAMDELRRRGMPTDNESLFTMIAMTEHPEGTTFEGTTYPGGAGAFDGSLGQRRAFASAFDILPAPDDPAYVFSVARPVNTQEANVHGWEFAGQYFFRDSGFGLMANYTVLDGDVDFDNTAEPGTFQFAILGLSNSANLVLMYEKHGVSARIAYNWRDQFLQGANLGPQAQPAYVDKYHQVDLSIGYQFNDRLSVALDGINVTGENTRWHQRSGRQLLFLEDQSARYSLQMRYKM